MDLISIADNGHVLVICSLFYVKMDIFESSIQKTLLLKRRNIF
jgi:hypothetical protein